MKPIHIALGASAALAGWMLIGTSPDVFGQTESRMEEAVAAKLRDPSSAEFRNVISGSSAICGEVNGKNAFGAYAGFKSFVYDGGIVLFEPERPLGSDVQGQTAYYSAVAEFARAKQHCYN